MIIKKLGKFGLHNFNKFNENSKKELLLHDVNGKTLSELNISFKMYDEIIVKDDNEIYKMIVNNIGNGIYYCEWIGDH
jgi:hypothetical protein